MIVYAIAVSVYQNSINQDYVYSTMWLISSWILQFVDHWHSFGTVISLDYKKEFVNQRKNMKSESLQVSQNKWISDKFFL